MSRTILFYNVFITINGDKTNISLTQLIDDIFRLSDEGKFWASKNLSMLYMNNISENTPSNRSFALAKYRDNYRPYTGRARTNIVNPILDDVIEFTCCCYIENARQLLVEYNHFGSRPNEVARYLSSFLPKSENNIWDICLEPIEAVRGLNILRRANRINSIEFNLDCTQTLPENFPAETFFGNFIQRAVESNIEFGANTATFKFSNGRKRLDIIHAHTLIQMIALLNLEDEIFTAVKIDFVDENNKKDTIDLKNGNLLKEVIMEDIDADGYEFIINQMEIEYELRNRPGNTAFTRFRNVIRNRTLPNILQHQNTAVTVPEEGA